MERKELTILCVAALMVLAALITIPFASGVNPSGGNGQIYEIDSWEAYVALDQEKITAEDTIKITADDGIVAGDEINTLAKWDLNGKSLTNYWGGDTITTVGTPGTLIDSAFNNYVFQCDTVCYNSPGTSNPFSSFTVDNNVTVTLKGLAFQIENIYFPAGEKPGILKVGDDQTASTMDARNIQGYNGSGVIIVSTNSSYEMSGYGQDNINISGVSIDVRGQISIDTDFNKLYIKDGASVTINNGLTFSDECTFSIGEGSSFNINSGTLTFGQNFTNEGTLTVANGATLNLAVVDGASYVDGNVTINGTLAFNGTPTDLYFGSNKSGTVILPSRTCLPSNVNFNINSVVKTSTEGEIVEYTLADGKELKIADGCDKYINAIVRIDADNALTIKNCLAPKATFYNSNGLCTGDFTITGKGSDSSSITVKGTVQFGTVIFTGVGLKCDGDSIYLLQAATEYVISGDCVLDAVTFQTNTCPDGSEGIKLFMDKVKPGNSAIKITYVEIEGYYYYHINGDFKGSTGASIACKYIMFDNQSTITGVDLRCDVIETDLGVRISFGGGSIRGYTTNGVDIILKEMIIFTDATHLYNVSVATPTQAFGKMYFEDYSVNKDDNFSIGYYAHAQFGSGFYVNGTISGDVVVNGGLVFLNANIVSGASLDVVSGDNDVTLEIINANVYGTMSLESDTTSGSKAILYVYNMVLMYGDSKIDIGKGSMITCQSDGSLIATFNDSEVTVTACFHDVIFDEDSVISNGTSPTFRFVTAASQTQSIAMTLYSDALISGDIKSGTLSITTETDFKFVVPDGQELVIGSGATLNLNATGHASIDGNVTINGTLTVGSNVTDLDIGLNTPGTVVLPKQITANYNVTVKSILKTSVEGEKVEFSLASGKYFAIPAGCDNYISAVVKAGENKITIENCKTSSENGIKLLNSNTLNVESTSTFIGEGLDKSSVVIEGKTDLYTSNYSGLSISSLSDKAVHICSNEILTFKSCAFTSFNLRSWDGNVPVSLKGVKTDDTGVTLIGNDFPIFTGKFIKNAEVSKITNGHIGKTGYSTTINDGVTVDNWPAYYMTIEGDVTFDGAVLGTNAKIRISDEGVLSLKGNTTIIGDNSLVSYGDNEVFLYRPAHTGETFKVYVKEVDSTKYLFLEGKIHSDDVFSKFKNTVYLNDCTIDANATVTVNTDNGNPTVHLSGTSELYGTIAVASLQDKQSVLQIDGTVNMHSGSKITATQYSKITGTGSVKLVSATNASVADVVFNGTVFDGDSSIDYTSSPSITLDLAEATSSSVTVKLYASVAVSGDIMSGNTLSVTTDNGSKMTVPAEKTLTIESGATFSTAMAGGKIPCIPTGSAKDTGIHLANGSVVTINGTPTTISATDCRLCEYGPSVEVTVSATARGGGTATGSKTVWQYDTYAEVLAALTATPDEGYVFDKWVYGTEEVTSTTQVKLGTDHSLTATFVVSATKVTVTFNPNNGESSFTEKIEPGSKLAEPKVTYDGHVFVGWFDGETLWIFATDAFDEDTTLEARWEVVKQEIVVETDASGKAEIAVAQDSDVKTIEIRNGDMSVTLTEDSVQKLKEDQKSLYVSITQVNGTEDVFEVIATYGDEPFVGTLVIELPYDKTSGVPSLYWRIGETDTPLDFTVDKDRGVVVFTTDHNSYYVLKYAEQPAPADDFNWALLIVFVAAVLSVLYVAVVTRKN